MPRQKRYLIVLSALIARAVSWRSEGTLPTAKSFAIYVGKFCFDYVHVDDPEEQDDGDKPIAGRFDVAVWGRVKPPGRHANQSANRVYFTVFDDEKDHWRRVRPFWDELSCEERLELASWKITLTPSLVGDRHEFNQTIHVRQAIRPRFWYFAFLNCGAHVLEPLQFKVHAVNIHQGFQREFGIDLRGSIVLEAIFGCLFTFLLSVSCGMVLCSRTGRLKKMSALLRVLVFSTICSAVGCIFRALHHAVFAMDGKGVLFAAVVGTTAACVAKALLMILLLLIAKGWALFLTPGEWAQRIGIVFSLTVVVLLTFGSEIWEQYFHDQSTDFYLYESWPGITLLAINSCILAMAWLFMWNTYKRETSDDVRSFYRLISLTFGLYFASLPIVCLLAELLNPWVRRKYVERFELSARFAVTAILLMRLRPSHLDTLLAGRLKNREQPKLLSTDMEVEMEGIDGDDS